MHKYDEDNKGNGYSGAQAIKSDLSSLRDDAVLLVSDVKEKSEGSIRAGIDHLFASTEREIQDIEKHVQEKPGQSILLAFAVGLFASYMLGGRR